jgi:AraC-like DNA-binding protein
MYATLVLRVVMYDVDIRLAKIIAMFVLMVVYGILTFLLRRGILDFHKLHRELPNEDEQMVLSTIPSPVLPQPQVRPAKLSVRDSSVDQPFQMHDQVSFYGDKARRLNELMENQQLFLQPDLSMATLAAELGTNRTYLSNLINQYLHTTFTSYVNSFRVRYAKSLLMTTNDSIEDIYPACGFQSRTTFWRAFAQMVGCTPKEFRRKAAQKYPPR